MSHLLRRLTAAEQTTAHLREEMLAGRWAGALPGVQALAAECDVSPTTMRAALRVLESEGRIMSGGAGRRRQVTSPDKPGLVRSSMRVAVLLDKRRDVADADFLGLLSLVRQKLDASGHVLLLLDTSQAELKHDLVRIARHVARTPADAWVVAGGEEATLRWFAARKEPLLAIGGRCLNLPVASAGFSVEPAFRAAVRRLIELGHRRIVFLCPQYFRQPVTSPSLNVLLEELSACGVMASGYHVPDWDETSAGLRQQLAKTFRYTPPTAILTTYPNWMLGVLAFLAQRGLQVPRDVSLVCMNHEAWFTWYQPTITHFRGDDARLVRRIVHWVEAAACDQADRKSISYPMKFVAGESIGPTPP